MVRQVKFSRGGLGSVRPGVSVSGMFWRSWKGGESSGGARCVKAVSVRKGMARSGESWRSWKGLAMRGCARRVGAW